jgi:hypothetical protein
LLLGSPLCVVAGVAKDSGQLAAHRRYRGNLVAVGALNFPRVDAAALSCIRCSDRFVVSHRCAKKQQSDD